MTVAPHTAAFFGDAEYPFRLSHALIIELESKCGAGIGLICNRVFARQFAQTDISETIRLALVGGGLKPERAAEMIKLYVAERPLLESYQLAAKILERLWIGAPDETKEAA